MGARYVSAEPDAPSLTLEWNRAALGVGIGLTGLFAADVDADGTVEIVAGGGGSGLGSNQRWYVLSHQGGGYDQEFASLPYPSGVGAVRVAQMDADAPLEVVVGSGTSVFVYDGASHALERTLALPSGAVAISSLEVADVDADGSLEVVATDGTDVFILNAASGVPRVAGHRVGAASTSPSGRSTPTPGSRSWSRTATRRATSSTARPTSVSGRRRSAATCASPTSTATGSARWWPGSPGRT